MAVSIPATLAILWLAAGDAPPPQPGDAPLPEVKETSIGAESPQAVLAALKAKPGVQVREENGWTIVEDQESEKVLAFWSFTPEGHPAYPSAVKRTVYEESGAVYVKMSVKCGASKEACDSLVRDFQRLNQRIQKQTQPE